MENSSQAEAVVKATDSDLGFLLNSDGSRISLVSEKGKGLSEEMTLPLCLISLKGKIKKVVSTVASSSLVDWAAKESNLKVIRTKVGQSSVTHTMLAEEAKAGGEGNGGIINTDVHACRDSFTEMALILEYLACSYKSISQLRQELPTYKMIKKKVKASFSDRKRIFNLITSKFKQGQVNTEDGIRIDYPEFWLHVRPSNTEPVMRIIIDQEAASLLKRKDYYLWVWKHKNEVYDVIKEKK